MKEYSCFFCEFISNGLNLMFSKVFHLKVDETFEVLKVCRNFSFNCRELYASPTSNRNVVKIPEKLTGFTDVVTNCLFRISPHIFCSELKPKIAIHETNCNCWFNPTIILSKIIWSLTSFVKHKLVIVFVKLVSRFISTRYRQRNKDMKASWK